MKVTMMMIIIIKFKKEKEKKKKQRSPAYIIIKCLHHIITWQRWVPLEPCAVLTFFALVPKQIKAC